MTILLPAMTIGNWKSNGVDRILLAIIIVTAWGGNKEAETVREKG